VIAFPENLRIKVVDQAAREAISGQQSIFESRRKLLSEQLKILDRTVAGLEAEIIGREGQIEASERQIALVDDELRDALTLLKQGLTNKPRVLALQRQKAELEGNVSNYVASIGAARQRIEEAHLRAAELQATSVFAVADQLHDVRSRVHELEQKLAAAEDVVRRTEIRSPINGVIVGLKIHTVGGVISAGEPLLDIVPINEELIVQASIDQLDIDQVEVGLPVTVWLWALNRRNRAALEGTLKTISADRLIDPNTGAAYYLARVELNTDAPEFRSVALHAGMSADVLIRTGARTPWEYLMAPITRSLALALREE
jgi:HlyD family type I secretion membrane fusion protein